MKNNKHKKLKFPKGFLWGAASAAHQVEGNNIHSDWWHWEKCGRITPSGEACDHYNRFEEDFALAKKMYHNAHRISIEWARVEPKEGKWDEKEIEHYRQVLESLKRNNLKSFVTLFHFTLPKWFADKGGFEKNKNLKYFIQFAEKMAQECEGLVDFWLTLNEPKTYALAGYTAGMWPPFKKSLFKTYKVYKHLAFSHNQIYKILKGKYPKIKIGAAINLPAIHFFGKPFKSFFEQLFAKLSNEYFVNKIKQNLDFFGLNYYFLIKGLGSHKIGGTDEKEIKKIVVTGASDFGWNFYPQGIYEVSKKLKKIHKPIYITENGTSDPNNDKRSRFILDHLEWVHQAISEGVDVRGYLHWSLMDNYEWTFGYEPKFGLCAVDFETQKRTPRKSAKLFGKICKDNSITA